MKYHHYLHLWMWDPHISFFVCYVFPLSYLAFADTHVPDQVLCRVRKACVLEDAGIVIELWITAFPGLKFAVYIAFLVFASLSRVYYFYNHLINKDWSVKWNVSACR